MCASGSARFNLKKAKINAFFQIFTSVRIPAAASLERMSKNVDFLVFEVP